MAAWARSLICWVRAACWAVGGFCGFPRRAPGQLHPALAASRLNDRHLTAIEAPRRMASRPLPWGGLIVSLGLGPPCDPFRQTGKRPGNPETCRTLRRSQPTVNPGCAHELTSQGRGAARPFPVPGGIGGITSWRKRVETTADSRRSATTRRRHATRPSKRFAHASSAPNLLRNGSEGVGSEEVNGGR